MPDTTDYRDLAQARANVYSFLSTLYMSPPTAGLLPRLSQPDFIAHLRDLFGEVVELMENALAQGDEASREQNLRLEYDALFRVPGPRYTRPYESVYRDRQLIGGQVVYGLVWGEATTAVKAMYAKAGVALAEETQELPDFIGLELGFMAFLCQQEGMAWERGDRDLARRYLELQREFLADHLSRWVSDFCQEMRAKAETGFYAGVAGMTREYVLGDQAEVEKLWGETA